MNERSSRPSSLPATCSHDELVLHALGRLDPRRREEVVAALARDPELAREAAQVSAHLGLYDRLPAAPEPPPFARLVARLGPQQARAAASRRRRWIPWAAAAGLLVTLGVFALRDAEHSVPAGWGRPGPGVTLTVAADGPPSLSAPDGPAEAWLGTRVRVVLDRGARLLPIGMRALTR